MQKRWSVNPLRRAWYRRVAEVLHRTGWGLLTAMFTTESAFAQLPARCSPVGGGQSFEAIQVNLLEKSSTQIVVKPRKLNLKSAQLCVRIDPGDAARNTGAWLVALVPGLELETMIAEDQSEFLTPLATLEARTPRLLQVSFERDRRSHRIVACRPGGSEVLYSAQFEFGRSVQPEATLGGEMRDQAKSLSPPRRLHRLRSQFGERAALLLDMTGVALMVRPSRAADCGEVAPISIDGAPIDGGSCESVDSEELLCTCRSGSFAGVQGRIAVRQWRGRKHLDELPSRLPMKKLMRFSNGERVIEMWEGSLCLDPELESSSWGESCEEMDEPWFLIDRRNELVGVMACRFANDEGWRWRFMPVWMAEPGGSVAAPL